MVPKMLRLAPLAALAFVLAACQVTFVPFDPDVAATINAQDSSEPTARHSGVALASGQSVYYEVRVPTARDLLYGEADGNGLRVRWLSAGGSTLAVSQSPRWFVSSTAQLSTSDLGDAEVATAEIGPRAIDVAFDCFGPCAAIAPTGSRYYLEVRNQSPVTQVFDLYVYTFDANDLNDRGSNSNQTAANATPFGASDNPSGAIELVGDVDWFRYTGGTARTLRFSVQDELLDLVLEFEVDGAIVEGTLDGLTTNLYPNDRFRIYSASGRAGPSGTSRYNLSVLP